MKQQHKSNIKIMLGYFVEVMLFVATGFLVKYSFALSWIVFMCAFAMSMWVGEEIKEAGRNEIRGKKK